MRCLSALLLLRDFDQFFFLVLIFICNACYKRCSATSQVRELESTAFRIPLVPQELRCRFQVMNEESPADRDTRREQSCCRRKRRHSLGAAGIVHTQAQVCLDPVVTTSSLAPGPHRHSPSRGQSLSLAFTVLWAQLWQQGIGWHVFTQQIFVEHVRSNDN